MSWVALGVGVAGTAASIYQSSQANKALDETRKNMPKYLSDPEVAKRLEQSKARLEGRATGAAAAERNIYQTGANAMANIQRGATDPNAVILGAGAVQGQQNVAFEGLQQQEAADYQQRLQDLAAAQQAENAERARQFGFDTQNYQMATQIEGAKQQNISNAIGTGINAGMGVGNIVNSAGGWSNVMGKSKNQDIKPNATITGMSNMPSNMLTMGYGQQSQLYPKNYLTMGYGNQSPYSWLNVKK